MRFISPQSTGKRGYRPFAAQVRFRLERFMFPSPDKAVSHIRLCKFPAYVYVKHCLTAYFLTNTTSYITTSYLLHTSALFTCWLPPNNTEANVVKDQVLRQDPADARNRADTALHAAYCYADFDNSTSVEVRRIVTSPIAILRIPCNLELANYSRPISELQWSRPHTLHKYIYMHTSNTGRLKSYTNCSCYFNHYQHHTTIIITPFSSVHTS
jgi:hypothetical protein